MQLNARQRQDSDHARGRHAANPNPDDCFGCAARQRQDLEWCDGLGRSVCGNDMPHADHMVNVADGRGMEHTQAQNGPVEDEGTGYNGEPLPHGVANHPNHPDPENCADCARARQPVQPARTDGDIVMELLRTSAMKGEDRHVAEHVAYVLAQHGRTAAIAWLSGFWYPTGTRQWQTTANVASILGVTISDLW